MAISEVKIRKITTNVESRHRAWTTKWSRLFCVCGESHHREKEPRSEHDRWEHFVVLRRQARSFPQQNIRESD